MKTQLRTSLHYPFNLDGVLCPLLNDAELLLRFYEEEGLRHGIKQFCKRTTWPGKPASTYAVDSEKLKELVLSLFNSPVARKTLEASRYTDLHNAIWQWFTSADPKLSERLSGCCDNVKGLLFMKCELWEKFLADVQKEKPHTDIVANLAYVTLAFAMLQEDDRYALGEAFLAVFPEYTEKLCGACPPTK